MTGLLVVVNLNIVPDQRHQMGDSQFFELAIKKIHHL